MKIYDISQELFSSVVFPGDPAPKSEVLASIAEGSAYNCSFLTMCAHNGTHVDAPYHFINDGKTIDQLPLDKTVGYAYVATFDGTLSASDALEILERAEQANPQSSKRILLRGKSVVSEEAAEVFSRAGIYLIGNESQTVGPESAPMKVHLILLSREVVLLEGVRLSHVPDGAYLLCAQPINLAGGDGSPCRAILIEDK